MTDSNRSSEGSTARTDSLFMRVNRELQKLLPLVGSMPGPLQQLLALCFCPSEDMKVLGVDERNKNQFAKFTFDFMRKARFVIVDLTALTDEYADAMNYVKPVYWSVTLTHSSCYI